MTEAARAFDRAEAEAIAHAFRSPRWYGNHWWYHYSRIKLGSDPLYPGVVAALRGSSAPLLDLGCGIGLLAHALRAGGVDLAYRGIDNDAGKVAQARRGAANAGLRGIDFGIVDLAAGLPAHRGSVALLDVLQFVPPKAHAAILDAALAMLTPGATLVIRTGLEDGSHRARFTRQVDALSRVFGWMNSGPKRYPQADGLRARLDAAGLVSDFTPLHGNTPFNNWLIVAKRPVGDSAS